MQQSNQQSWIHEPYVWMLILIPFSSVVVGMIMLNFAIQSDTGLVVDDYYKRGKEINWVLARDNIARDMGLSATITITRNQDSLTLNLASSAGALIKEPLSLNFYHATRSGWDQSLALREWGTGLYRASILPLQPGRWDVQLGTDSWRLVGSLQSPDQRELRLIATPGPRNN